MTLEEVFWTEVIDLPNALLVLADGGSHREVADELAFSSFDDEELARVRKRAQKALAALFKGSVNQVGRQAVKELNGAGVRWTAWLKWDEQLALGDGMLAEPTTLEAHILYAIALTADRCSRNQHKLVRCERCSKFAFRDPRGGGGNPHRWCSTKCRNAAAQQADRDRERDRRAHLSRNRPRRIG